VESGAGNVSTAFEVERVITFVRPELVLFVGVAGGLKDVRLGDVVIGTKVYAYESGKEKETLETRPVSQPASYRLAQRAKAEIRNGLWVRRIKGKLLDGIPELLQDQSPLARRSSLQPLRQPISS
jgi:nucleoside phosphorylase